MLRSPCSWCRYSQEMAKLSAGIVDGAYLDSRLQELHSSRLSERAGGVLRWFVLWDLLSFLVVFLVCYYKASATPAHPATTPTSLHSPSTHHSAARQVVEYRAEGLEVDLDDWRLRTTLYFGKARRTPRAVAAVCPDPACRVP